MDDDFLQRMLGGGSTSHQSSHDKGHATLADLTSRLADIIAENTTPTRTSHISTTLHLKSSAELDLSLGETEHDAFENHQPGIDPSLRDSSSSSNSRAASVGRVQTVNGQTQRIISASDALTNQTDNPLVQRTVSKRVVAAISEADTSSWIVRDFSRGAEGWKITYICKDSHQEWARQSAKNPPRHAILEYSSQEQDPVIKARPAFDCRGSIVITFPRRESAISIQYDHTPLHRTIAQMSEHFKPPPIPKGHAKGKGKATADGKQGENGAETAPDGVPKEKSKSHKKRTSTALDENGNPKPPRKRKKQNDAGAEGDSVIDPVLAGDQAQTPKPKRSKKRKSKAAQAVDGVAVTPDGQPAAATFGSQDVESMLPLNVSAEESQQRRERAMALLAEAGVDPDSLNKEQFDIFSNQSPGLQEESLSLLVEYGAERLQIVHPDGGAQPQPSDGSSQPDAPPAQPAASSAPEVQAPTKKKSHKKKPATTATADAATTAPASQMALTIQSKPAKRPKKTRGACDPCREAKLKCTKQKPACAVCTDRGATCHYRLEVSRQDKESAKKSAEVVVVEEDSENEEAAAADQTMADDTAVDETSDDINGGLPDHQADASSYHNQSHMSVAPFNTQTPEIEPEPGQTYLGLGATDMNIPDQLSHISQQAMSSMTQSYTPEATQSPLIALPDLHIRSTPTINAHISDSPAPPTVIAVPQGSAPPHWPAGRTRVPGSALESPAVAAASSSTWATTNTPRTTSTSPLSSRRGLGSQQTNQLQSAVQDVNNIPQQQQQQHQQQQQINQQDSQTFSSHTYAPQQTASMPQAVVQAYTQPSSTPSPHNAQPAQIQPQHLQQARAGSRQSRRSESRTPTTNHAAIALPPQPQTQIQHHQQSQPAQSRQVAQPDSLSFTSPNLNGLSANYASYSGYANTAAATSTSQQSYKSQAQQHRLHQQQTTAAANPNPYQSYDNSTYNRASTASPANNMPAYNATTTNTTNTTQRLPNQTRNHQTYDTTISSPVTASNYPSQASVVQTASIPGYSNLRQQSNVQVNPSEANYSSNPQQQQPQQQQKTYQASQQPAQVHQTQQPYTTYQTRSHGQPQSQPVHQQQQTHQNTSSWQYNSASQQQQQQHQYPQVTAPSNANAAAYGRPTTQANTHTYHQSQSQHHQGGLGPAAHNNGYGHTTRMDSDEALLANLFRSGRH